MSNEELKRYASRHNVNSVLLIPLKAGEEINYFLVFYAKDRRQEFTDQEIELLNFFGKEIMKALRIEKLDDILHDFKNPGIAIAGFAKRAKRLLEKEDIESVKDKIADYLDIVMNEAIRMQEIAIYPNIEGRERVVDLTEVLKSRFRINEEAIREQRRTNINLCRMSCKRVYSFTVIPLHWSVSLITSLTMLRRPYLKTAENYPSRAIRWMRWHALRSVIPEKYLKRI